MQHTHDKAINRAVKRLKSISVAVARHFIEAPVMGRKLVPGGTPVFGIDRETGKPGWLPRKKWAPVVKEKPTQNDWLKTSSYHPAISFSVVTQPHMYRERHNGITVIAPKEQAGGIMSYWFMRRFNKHKTQSNG